MPQDSRAALCNALGANADLSARFLFSRDASAALVDMARGSILVGRGHELYGRSVLLAASDQFVAALALIELDGIARRIVLCPPDLQPEHLAYVLASASVEAIVSDQTIDGLDLAYTGEFIQCGREIAARICEQSTCCRTEWILLTSGTTGRPKLVVHTRASLAGAIARSSSPANRVVWSTFYDIRRYGGLQIFLRAILTGTSLVLSGEGEPTAEFLTRAGASGVTHISGTPSHWRRALMSPMAHAIAPQYIRLSGEIADQSILNSLRSFYPNARIVHAFASTEAGVGFEVTDGLAGFPGDVIGSTPDVCMKIENRSLRIRSTRTADRYLGTDGPRVKDDDGFVDTGDIVELRNDRYYFLGRRDGVINVGGRKVCPEEVEAVINRHPEVRMSLVRTKKNPITGALVVADVVLKAAPESAPEDVRQLRENILLLCRNALSAHKIPSAINFVPALAVAESGKLMRDYA